MSRERDLLELSIGIRHDGYNNKTTSATTQAAKKHCVDVITNPHGQNPLQLQSVTITGGKLNGYCNWILKSTLTDYPIQGAERSASYLVPSSLTYVNGLRNAALARTGLSSPRVNIPLFIGELKDIPRMLKHAGDVLHKLQSPRDISILRDGASATLAYQFGWRPLIDDLRKMMNFHDIVEKRMRQINRSHDTGGGYKGTATVDNFTSQSITRNVLVNSDYGYQMRRDITVVTSQRSWASVPWTPRSNIRNLGSDALKAKAFREALGLSRRNIPLTVWKLMPWTWFIDYFVNISEMIQAIDNQIDYQPGSGCIMVNRTVTRSFAGGPLGSTGLTCSNFERVSEIKSRYPISSWGDNVPTMKLPFLDNFKLSVLGSLAILKIVR